MKGFVSSNPTRIISLVASLSIVWIVYVQYGFPWVALAFAGLAAVLAASALLASKASPGSITDLIESVEAEPLRATVAPVRVANPAPRVIL